MTTDNVALVRTMAERFLSWKLPENFNPDGGIKFDRVVNLGTLHQYYHEPTGTNLLDFTQAKQMIEYLLAGLDLTTPHPKPLDPPAQDEVVLDALRDAYWAGAMAVHNAWVNDLGQNDPDFGEAASDYAQAAITALRQHQSAEIEALRAENARLRGALGEGARWFEEYAIEHDAKARSAGSYGEQIAREAKGKRNQERADFLRAALEGGAK